MEFSQKRIRHSFQLFVFYLQFLARCGELKILHVQDIEMVELVIMRMGKANKQFLSTFATSFVISPFVLFVSFVVK